MLAHVLYVDISYTYCIYLETETKNSATSIGGELFPIHSQLSWGAPIHMSRGRLIRWRRTSGCRRRVDGEWVEWHVGMRHQNLGAGCCSLLWVLKCYPLVLPHPGGVSRVQKTWSWRSLPGQRARCRCKQGGRWKSVGLDEVLVSSQVMGEMIQIDGSHIFSIFGLSHPQLVKRLKRQNGADFFFGAQPGDETRCEC